MTNASNPSAALPGAELLAGLGIGEPASQVAESVARFPDGGSWRVEIPTVEGPDALREVLSAADRYAVPIHRVSQGSGVLMLTDDEITEMVRLCRDRAIELCLFVRAGANWDIGAQAASSAGGISARARGRHHVEAAVAEAVRATGLGVRSLLVADEGVLWTLHRLRVSGALPADLQLKMSVMAGTANPAGLQVLQRLGADTVNVPSDLTIAQFAELRAGAAVPVDFYVEAPDNIGGFVRHYEIADVVAAAAPIYLKFGLRGAPDVYPAGEQVAATVLSSARERVRRARLGLDMLARIIGSDAVAATMSPLGNRDQPHLDRFPT